MVNSLVYHTWLVLSVWVTSQEIRRTTFSRVYLSADLLPGTQLLSAKSRIDCAALCGSRSACTASSYLPLSCACHLHVVDLTSYTCAAPVTSAFHLKKDLPTTPIICQNNGTAVSNSTACRCNGGYVGTSCERLMVDCKEGLTSGHYPTMTGLYQARPTGSPGPVTVRCDSNVQHILLIRWQADISFNRSRADYVKGFGSGNKDFWVGLETLNYLTNQNFTYTLGAQVSNVSNSPFFQHYYTGFKVNGPADNYSMTFTSTRASSTPASPMGDCFSALKNLPFSAYDVDNDGNTSRNCAADYGGGFWYSPLCSECNLMGELRYFSLSRIPGSVSEVFWNPGLPSDFSPASALMFLFRL